MATKYENYAILNGVVLPTPSLGSGKQDHSIIVDSGRNANGVVIGSVIGRTQSKISMEWKIIARADWEKVAKILHDNLFVTLEYYDFALGRRITRRMYHGDFSAEPFITDANGVPKWYQNCKVNFIDTGSGS